MSSKSLDQYFESARSIPIAMSFEEVQALVKIKGVTITKHQVWWKSKNFIFMTTLTTIVTTAIMLITTSKEVKQQPVNTPTTIIEKQEVVKENSQLAELTTNKYTPKEEPIPEKSNKEVSTPLARVESLAPVISIEMLLKQPVFNKQMNLLKEDTLKEQHKKGHSKTIKKEYSANGIDELKVGNFEGNITVKTWDQPTIEMVAHVTIDGYKEEEIKKALHEADINFLKSGNKLEIKNPWNNSENCCRSTIIGRKKVVMKSGDKVKLKKYQVDYVLTVPNQMSLNLKNSYGNITIDDIDGDVSSNIFQGNFTAGNINGKLKLTGRYGNAKLNNVTEGNITLFENDAEIGKLKKLRLDVRYSEIELKGVEQLELNAFQADIEVKQQAGVITGTLKYGDLIIETNTQKIDLNMFEANIEVEEVDVLDLEGSYSKIKATTVDEVILKASFENSYRIGEVTKLNGDARYTSFDIGTLKNTLQLETFDGRIDVDKILGEFSILNIDSKYTSIDLIFGEEAKFNLDARTTYTNFSYSKEDLQVSYQSVGNSKLDVKGMYKANNTKKPSMVNVVCFEGSLNLK